MFFISVFEGYLSHFAFNRNHKSFPVFVLKHNKNISENNGSNHRGAIYTRGDKSLEMCQVGHFYSFCVYCSCTMLTQARFIEKAATRCDCSYVLRALLGGAVGFPNHI